MIYNLSVLSYVLGISIASLFNSKARQWKKGRKNIFKRLESAIKPGESIFWIHCASLGEFEQGRPLIEKIKNEKPELKVLLTFFSPSGYEIRKNYEHADYIFYLPPDFRRKAKRFIRIVNPSYVIFVKYEFWYHYLNILRKTNVPTYCISAIFRKDQVFFRSMGKWYRNVLLKFTHLFVQNEKSKELLAQYNINNVTIAGDTRFDRVQAIVQQAKEIPVVEVFKENKPVLIAGSSWPPDEKLLLEYINDTSFDIKLIIAPHEIHEEKIVQIEKQLKLPSIRFTEANESNCKEAKVLIVNNMGMLSSLYKYGTVAYIGGGFGKGIHNILEAATFGLPVLFGPNYQKFQEAVNLINEGGAFSLSSYKELESHLDRLFGSSEQLQLASSRSKKYVEANLGGTEKILGYLFEE
ncbi:MAG: 3-deoxy-D-manno-octulosonic acid transferase [Bacteroidales bacterium]|nr:3-deoxy-D-manno-octulosonic acid transferase [Bacteroidales bacterium]